jgi:hypothetical protein
MTSLTCSYCNSFHELAGSGHKSSINEFLPDLFSDDIFCAGSWSMDEQECIL